MITLLCFLWIVSLGIMIVIYLQYAYANYPKSKRWEFLLIGSSFIWGCSLGLLASIQSYTGGKLILVILLCGIISVILNRFVGMYRLIYLLPKRNLPTNTDHTD
jgi:hypothetical protein